MTDRAEQGMFTLVGLLLIAGGLTLWGMPWNCAFGGVLILLGAMLLV